VTANIAAVPISNIASLNRALEKSRVLVSSEVYAPNGSRAQIVNTENIPTFSTDISGNTMTQYQNLETSIVVVPNTIDYRAENPEQSRVRVDINAKVSVISGERQKGSVTAPEFSVKSFSTTRIMKADGQIYLMGTFTSDSTIKSSTGFPVLSSIPLLKYLFSKEAKTIQRNTAFLTLSVRLLPLDQSYTKDGLEKAFTEKRPQ
jgi:type II secretory pathway component GspD/PulD (secretin)